MRENLIFDSLPGRAGQGKGMVKWLGDSVVELGHLTQHLSDHGVVVLLCQVRGHSVASFFGLIPNKNRIKH